MTDDSKKPDAPEEPDAPKKPDAPEKPAAPEKPDAPDAPEKPAAPEEPDAPDAPEKPAAPEKPGGSDALSQEEREHLKDLDRRILKANRWAGVFNCVWAFVALGLLWVIFDSVLEGWIRKACGQVVEPGPWASQFIILIVGALVIGAAALAAHLKSDQADKLIDDKKKGFARFDEKQWSLDRYASRLTVIGSALAGLSIASFIALSGLGTNGVLKAVLRGEYASPSPPAGDDGELPRKDSTHLTMAQVCDVHQRSRLQEATAPNALKRSLASLSPVHFQELVSELGVDPDLQEELATDSSDAPQASQPSLGPEKAQKFLDLWAKTEDRRRQVGNNLSQRARRDDLLVRLQTLTPGVYTQLLTHLGLDHENPKFNFPEGSVVLGEEVAGPFLDMYGKGQVSLNVIHDAVVELKPSEPEERPARLLLFLDMSRMLLVPIMALLGSLFFIAGRIHQKASLIRNPQEGVEIEPYDPRQFWSGLFYRSGQAVLFSLVIYFLSLTDEDFDGVTLLLVVLFLGMFVKSAETALLGLADGMFNKIKAWRQSA